MELKFDPKCKWSVFRAKYLKSEIEFEDHYLLCVCCGFATFPSFDLEAVWGDFLFNGPCNHHVKVKPVRDKTSGFKMKEYSFSSRQNRQICIITPLKPKSSAHVCH